MVVLPVEVEVGLGPERTHDVDLLIENSGPVLEVRAEGFVLGPVPSDADRDADATAAQQVDRRDLLRGKRGLTLREDEDAGDKAQLGRDGGEVAEQHEDLVEGVGRGVGRAREAAHRARTEAFGCRAEDVVVGHQVREARFLCSASPVPDRVGIGAAVSL